MTPQAPITHTNDALSHHHTPSNAATTTPIRRFVGFGDPVLDTVTAVSFEILTELGMHAGGCTSIPICELEHLLSRPEIHNGHLMKVPGGSAANVCKCIAGLQQQHQHGYVAFVGMIGADAAGVEYASMLKSHGVTPILAECIEADAATAACLCLISPDGQRTMRTHLGACQQFTSLQQLSAAQQQQLLVCLENGETAILHFEGYAMFKKDIMVTLMRSARRCEGGGGHSCKISLDLASFEVVKSCWEVLHSFLEEKLVDVLFLNEDEARAVFLAAGGLLENTNFTKEEHEEEEEEEEEVEQQLISAVQTYFLQFVEVVVMTLGKKGCVVATAKGERISAPADGDVTIVDTVGAGDFFSAGFLHAWMQGFSLQACAKCGCAAGAAAVQSAGADLGADGMERLRQRVNGDILCILPV